MLSFNSFLFDLFEMYRIEDKGALKKYSSLFEKLNIDFSEDIINEEDERLKGIIEKLKRDLFDRDKKYKYIDRLINQSGIYESLKKYDIDGISLSLYKRLEKNSGIVDLLESFRYYDKLKYTRSNIVSGRLSIVKGPRFMQLPKKYRNVVKSRFSEGEILMVDYVSLEPRVARYIVGGEAKEDIYQGICDELDFVVDRAVMKRAVISILYGASEEMEIGELSQDKIGLIRNKVNEYFNINHLLELAMKQDEWGYRRSFWGRPIHWGEDVRLNQILNGYIQSTAVDVALDGFLNMTKQFNEGMRPLFFIHDAMFVDVKKDCKNDFVNIIKQGYNCKELGFFPLNIELISERKY